MYNVCTCSCCCVLLIPNENIFSIEGYHLRLWYDAGGVYIIQKQRFDALVLSISMRVFSVHFESFSMGKWVELNEGGKRVKERGKRLYVALMENKKNGNISFRNVRPSLESDDLKTSVFKKKKKRKTILPFTKYCGWVGGRVY